MVSPIWWSVRTRKNLAALTHELFQDWSLIWSIYIPFWLTYLHSSSLSKQNSSSDLLKLAVTGNFRFITSEILPTSFFQVSEKMNGLDPWITDFPIPIFPVTVISKRSTEDCLFEEERQMKIFCRNRQVCKVNASYEWPIEEQVMGSGSAAKLFLVQTDHQSWDIFSMVKCLQTTQNQPKNSC